MEKVLHLGKYYPPEPGGMEQVLRGLVEATRGRVEHDCLLAARSGGSRVEESPGVRLRFLEERGTLLLAPVLPTLPFVLHRLRKELRAEVLVLHLPNPLAVVALALSLALRPPRERIVAWHHADVVFEERWKRAIQALYLPFERFVLRRTRAFVAATPHHVASSPSLRRFADRVTVIPYAVPDAWFEAAPGDAERARAAREEMGGRFVLFVGRLAAYKGLETLVEAASTIDARVAVVGAGPLEEGLRGAIAARGLGERVRMIGRVDDLRGWYAACELLVLPSSSVLEAFGLVQVEAMAFGKPVVTSDLPTGVTWVNRDGETGLTFPVGDAAALASACNRLLGDEPLRRRLGERARERARREFSEAACGGKFVELVRTLAAEAAG